MAVTKNVYTNVNSGSKIKYVSLSGTEAEVLQALVDERVEKNNIVVMKDDGTFAVYCRY